MWLIIVIFDEENTIQARWLVLSQQVNNENTNSNDKYLYLQQNYCFTFYQSPEYTSLNKAVAIEKY